MNLRHFFIALSASALLVPGVACAQYTLNVREADIRAFIADAAEVTGRTFIVDARVQGKVSVVSDRPLSRSEYFEVFLSTLRANSLVAVPTGNGAFRIQPVEGAASQPMRIGSRGAARNQMVTEIVRLSTIDAPQAVETLRPLVSKDGSITANKAGNSLVVVDYADNIARIRALVRSIDRDQSSTRTVMLDHAGAREIATALAQLVPAGGEGGRSLASVVAVDSSNALLLRGDAATIGRLEAMARQLDARAAHGGEIKVLWLDYADAAVLVPVLERLVGGTGGSEVASGSQAPVSLGGVGGSSTSTGGTQGSTTPAGGQAAGAQGVNPTGGTTGGLGSGPIKLEGGRGTATITRYPGANAVIIAAPADEQRRLTELVRQLDVPQEQVLVEAIIVEISNDVARQLGVQMLLGGKNMPFAVTNYSNVSPNIIDIAGGLYADKLDSTTTVINGSTVTTTTNSTTGDLLRQNAANAILGAQGGFGGFVTDLGKDGVLGALINAVQSDTNSNILSTPHITTNNNVPASILFGKEIPVATGEALSSANYSNTFRTIQRQNVGIELDVTPQINAGNQIRLDLRQQVSSIAGPVSSSNSELIINKREIKTTVTVGDREIVVLGGLLDDNERRTIEKVPLLGDVPLLGELFKSRGKSHVKTNLMVFIRPTIMRNGADRAALTARRYGVIRNAQSTFDPKREPNIDELIVDYMGAALPAVPTSAPGDAVIAPGAGKP
ncbi:type II secretion system secretin GspD [Novosphingobium olei]|uniref:Type II secretion system secretin GspD n=1 Tax=Novosphingobium olei TaxID=2728851 RepID=A0A7Y0BKH1_9SPHN|nr:type II secretion system secretin GspD [Novosphingobium olei]NML92127.1 type II secretion system secretin GspD [Novosphingobium olei]BEV02007.1 type II secretion system secretin GspD [Novosphingobium olei]